MNIKNKEYLSVSETAELLCINQQAIYKLIKSNTIPYYRFGKLIKIKNEDIQKFIQDNYHNNNNIIVKEGELK
jgi:excisionase family DNA binding protein